MSCAKGSLPTPIDTALRTRCRGLYEAGSTFADIEVETGVKNATIRSWQRRDAWERASETSELAVVEPQEIVEVPESLPDQVEEYETNMRRAAVTFSRFVADLPGETITAKSQHIKNVDQTARKALQIESQKPLAIIQIGVLAQSPAKRDSERLRSHVRPEVLELTE